METNIFLYLIQHFNIVGICGDYNGGVQFINSCNESALFKQENIKIGIIEVDLEKPENWNLYQWRKKSEKRQQDRYFPGQPVQTPW